MSIRIRWCLHCNQEHGFGFDCVGAPAERPCCRAAMTADECEAVFRTEIPPQATDVESVLIADMRTRGREGAALLMRPWAHECARTVAWACRKIRERARAAGEEGK